MTYARFLSPGKLITPCVSMDLRAKSSISARFSRKYLATSALANWLTASFHSALATFRCFAPLLSAAISRSPSVVSEHSNRKFNDGRLGSISGLFLAGKRTLYPSQLLLQVLFLLGIATRTEFL